MNSLASPSPAPLVPALAGLESAVAPLARPLVRVAAGLFLVPHGAQKLFGWFGGYGIEATGQFFETKLGLPASMALLAGLIEVFAGLALAIGFGTRIAAGLATGLLMVAAFQVHLPAGFFAQNGGLEYPLLWGIVTLSFVLSGGGRFSVDRLIGREI